MEKRILLEKRGRSPSEIKDLSLDNCCSSTIVGFTDEFCNLETLSMINVGLTNLRGFPKLPNLKKLELSDNRISGGLNILSSNCPKLNSLHLGGNKIDNIDILEPLKELSDLVHLELTNCEVASLENYREKIFKLLPNLKYLDGFDQNDKEIDEESETENGKADRWSGDEDEESIISVDSEVEDDSEEDQELGLKCLQEDLIDEESEGDDYNPDGENSEDEEIEDDSDEDSPSKEKTPRGEKRKLESDE